MFKLLFLYQLVQVCLVSNPIGYVQTCRIPYNWLLHGVSNPIGYVQTLYFASISWYFCGFKSHRVCSNSDLLDLARLESQFQIP